ncbi:MAG: serine/threonine protein kinase [Pyrinomonadaceae bacterium]|nr:serine/threonine protein kinase [Pyrinomonadaceae bacterium]
MFGAHDEAANFIDSPAYLEADFVNPNFDEDSPDETPERIGEIVGSYEIVREIGRGGMGTVYLAHRVNGDFRQEVAVKIVKRGMDTNFVVSRFRRERQILASLNHPNIARLFEGGTTTDGLPYFVMEFVDGQDLMKFSDEHDLSVNERLNLFREICGAVNYAHQNLVVHRDLKPSNILVTPENVPKLLDFGIAKLLNSPSNDAADTTNIYRLLTPEYASPEQIRGETITTASDVYSLGVCLYELLSGQHPFRRKKHTPHEWMQAICEKEPTKPSLATVEQESVETRTNGNPKPKIRNLKLLRGDLDNIILKSLQKEPSRRYSSASEMSEDIRRYLHGLPVSAQADKFSYRAQKFVKRHKISVSATAFFSLLLLFVTAFAVRQAIVANAERTRAEQRFNQVRQLANTIIFDHYERIKNLSGSTQAREKLVSDAIFYLDNLAQEADKDDDLQRELALAYRKIGDIQGSSTAGGNLGKTSAALESYQKALTIQTGLAAKNVENIEDKRLLAGLYLNVMSQSDKSDSSNNPNELCDRAIEILSELIKNSPEDIASRSELARALWYSGDSLRGQGNDDAAIVKLKQALMIYDELALIDSPKKADYKRSASLARKNLGGIFQAKKDFVAAGDYYQSALKTDMENSQANPENVQFQMDLSFSYLSFAAMLASLKEFDTALENTQKALAIQEKIVANDEKNVFAKSALARTYKRRGGILEKLEKFDEVLPDYQKSLAIYEKLVADDNQNANYQKGLTEIRASIESLATQNVKM